MFQVLSCLFSKQVYQSVKVFLFPSEDVHARNHKSFPINFRTSSVTIDDASHLAATLVQEIPADCGNFPWYMTDSVAILLRCRETTQLCKRDVREQYSRS